MNRGHRSRASARLAPVGLVWALASASLPSAAGAATIVVPTDASTIQQAVNRAAPGDVIRVLPGTYRGGVRVAGSKTGLTIEGADPAQPPILAGTPHVSADGIRVDRVDGVVLRHLRIVGAYDGIRLNDVVGATVLDVRVDDDNALGIRVNRGRDNSIGGCVVLGTRVEQGILIASSPGATVASSLVLDASAEGILVSGSPNTIVQQSIVVRADNTDGIAVRHSDGARVVSCTSSMNGHNGIRISDSANLVLLGNTANDNRDTGLRIEQSTPFRSVGDVLAAGNRATRNGGRDVVVAAPSCNSTTCDATTTTTAASTTTSTSGGQPSLVPARWQLYVRAVTRSGASINLETPLRAADPPLAVAIPEDQLAAFRIGKRVSGAEVAALGGDTLARLLGVAEGYARAHASSYPPLDHVVELLWAERMGG